MAFDKEKIKANYSTDKHNVLGDFYIPALNNATNYDRAVGYFSSKALLYIIQGLDGLIKNNGKMRLIVGSPLTQDEYDSINSLETQDKIFNQISSQWNILVHKELSELRKYRLEVFSWLVKTKKLEIKFALRKPGAIFHKKIGVISGEDFTVVFNGSLNETESALDNNSENFNVFRSWKEESFKDYGEYHIEEFDSVWKGNESGTITFDIPSRYYDDVKNYWSSEGPPSSELEKEAAKKIAEMFKNKEKQLQEPEYDFIKPRIPKKIDGHKYQIRDHQISALQKWEKNNYNGIMALATGAGKTITAIHGAVKIAQENRLFMIVAVPYQILADQWCDVLNSFNIKPIKCYDNKSQWYSKLVGNVGSFNLEVKEFVGVVVVNKTLGSSLFQSQIRQIKSKELFFIGDECHHHSSEGLMGKIPNAKFKLGLSATPWSEKELNKAQILTKYYGDIVEEYSLSQALSDGILVNYKYHVYYVFFNEDEDEKYRELSKTISQLTNKKNKSQKEKDILKFTIFKRSRLLDSLEDKFTKLDELLNNRKPQNHTLFYCGAGSSDEIDEEEPDKDIAKTINKITKILTRHNWSSANFTYKEGSKDRLAIMEEFKQGNINALSSIKVLDEGFDVPVCREAYITASSTNERQYIQRRGRILRKSKDKEMAVIHDFVILPNHYDRAYATLVNNEFSRVVEFYKDSSNKKEFEIDPFLSRIRKLYSIDQDILIKDSND